MKKLFFIIPVLFFALFSCEQDELNDLNKDVEQLQDSLSIVLSQHEALLDSITDLINSNQEDQVDVKALKMEQIYMLFISIGRQPEMGDDLIKITELLYEDYTVLLPLSDKAVSQRGKARGIALGGLFEAVGRQPEAMSMLDDAAMKFLGVYDPSYISDELLEYSKIYAHQKLVEALARQPEAGGILNVLTKKYLNMDISQFNIE